MGVPFDSGAPASDGAISAKDSPSEGAMSPADAGALDAAGCPAGRRERQRQYQRTEQLRRGRVRHDASLGWARLAAPERDRHFGGARLCVRAARRRDRGLLGSERRRSAWRRHVDRARDVRQRCVLGESPPRHGAVERPRHLRGRHQRLRVDRRRHRGVLGSNAYGAIGNGTSTGPDMCSGMTPCATSPVEVMAGPAPLTGVTAISVGDFGLVCALMTGGTRGHGTLRRDLRLRCVDVCLRTAHGRRGEVLGRELHGPAGDRRPRRLIDACRREVVTPHVCYIGCA